MPSITISRPTTGTLCERHTCNAAGGRVRPPGMRLAFVAVPLLLLLAGCGDRPTSPAGSAVPDLRGKTFLATAVTEGGTPRALVQGTELSVEFTDDGRLIANAGCNIMQGPVDTAGGKLVTEG